LAATGTANKFTTVERKGVNLSGTGNVEGPIIQRKGVQSTVTNGNGTRIELEVTGREAAHSE